VCQPPGTPPLLEGTYGATMKDRNDTLGLSVKGKINAKWKVGADVLYTKSRSTYDEGWDPTNVVGGDSARYPTSGGVTAQELPDIKTELARFGVYADYAVQKNASLRLDVIYEHWKTNDWTYTFADGNSFSYGTNGANADGTTFSQSSPQNSTFIGLRYKYMLD
jgi:predicted porin